MHAFAQLALPGTIVASAIGAVVLCIVLLLYGFKSEPDDERAPARRLLVIRLGHALAAACFAAALMLSTVALIEQRRVIAQATIATARSGEDVRRLAAHVDALEQRVAATELRVGDVESARTVVATPVAVESRRPTAPRVSRPRKAASVPARGPAAARANEVTPSPMREPGDAVTVQAASSAPLTASATNVSASDDFGARARGDWEAVKHGFRQAGRNVRSGFTDLGHQIKRAFD